MKLPQKSRIAFQITPLVGVLCALVMLSPSVRAQDLGTPDSLVFEATELVAGQSSPVSIRVVNDYPLQQVALPLELTAGEYGAFVSIDSIVFRGRLSDVSVFDIRQFLPAADGGSPDTLLIAWSNVLGTLLPPGNGVVADLYFTGSRDGSILLDAGVYLPFVSPQMSAEAPGGGYTQFIPVFVAGEFPILMGTLPAQFTMPAGPIAMVGREETVLVGAESPEGYALDLALLDLVTAGEPPVAPANAPTTEGTNPMTVRWTPAAGEVGSWEAMVEACNLFAICDQATVLIQVIDGGDVSGDGLVNLSDITMLVNWLFVTSELPPDPSAGDVNMSGDATLTDLTLLVNYLFIDI